MKSLLICCGLILTGGVQAQSVFQPTVEIHYVTRETRPHLETNYYRLIPANAMDFTGPLKYKRVAIDPPQLCVVATWTHFTRKFGRNGSEQSGADAAYQAQVKQVVTEGKRIIRQANSRGEDWGLLSFHRADWFNAQTLSLAVGVLLAGLGLHQPGTDFVGTIHKAVESAALTILAVGLARIADRHGTFDWHAALSLLLCVIIIGLWKPEIVNRARIWRHRAPRQKPKLSIPGANNPNGRHKL